MKKIFESKSFNKVNFFSIIFAVILLVCFVFIVIYSSYTQYKKDIELLDTEFIQAQKKSVEDETKRILNYIKYKHQKESNKTLKQLQEEIIEDISHMRNESDRIKYVFIYNFDGINILDSTFKENKDANLLHNKDINNKKVIDELIKVSKESDGGYVEYIWNKPVVNKLSEKISYAISYKPWGWMIGSGIYLDNINSDLKNIKDSYYKQISNYLAQIFMTVIFLFLIGVFIYKYLMNIVQKDIQLIKLSSQNLRHIDSDELILGEFKQVALHINTMKNNLEDLNKNLEKKVNLRTQELKRSEQYAVSLVEQQDKFVKDAIHEINTPLSIIITNIDLFKLKFSSNKYLSKIEAGSKIIHNIYNDLEYMVKKDRINYNATNIELSMFIEDRIEFFSEIAIGNDLKFKYEIEDDIILSFNEVLLQRVCDNTFSNAIKYSYKDTEILVKLYKKDEKIYFEVINQGDTIKDTDKLFDRFYRENSSRGGFGIGLNIIKEICVRYDIDMEVFSQDGVTSFIYIFKLK